jgi:pantothenate kinase-related protein Tda10
MYVLSFYDEATLESTITETSIAFNKKKHGLCKLARRNIDNDDPLCMFITGPAGAGKCKLRKR